MIEEQALWMGVHKGHMHPQFYERKCYENSFKFSLGIVVHPLILAFGVDPEEHHLLGS